MASTHLTVGSGGRHVMALLSNAELEVLANAGYYPLFETPVALATAMEEFLGRE